MGKIKKIIKKNKFLITIVCVLIVAFGSLLYYLENSGQDILTGKVTSYNGKDMYEQINEEPVLEDEPIVYVSPQPRPICVCSYNAYDCADFETHEDAQKCFEFCDKDIHILDLNRNGLACETLD